MTTVSFSSCGDAPSSPVGRSESASFTLSVIVWSERSRSRTLSSLKKSRSVSTPLRMRWFAYLLRARRTRSRVRGESSPASRSSGRRKRTRASDLVSPVVDGRMSEPKKPASSVSTTVRPQWASASSVLAKISVAPTLKREERRFTIELLVKSSSVGATAQRSLTFSKILPTWRTTSFVTPSTTSRWWRRTTAADDLKTSPWSSLSEPKRTSNSWMR